MRHFVNHRIASFLRLSLFAVLLAGLALQPHAPVYAAASLTVTPITWNIIGLDSNNVNVGPNHFPIGAEVCNTGDTTAFNVRASFVWDSANTYINLRPGTAGSGTGGAPADLPASGTINLPATPGSNCTEFYFEVEVTRNAAAYDTTRRYHIAVTADGGATTGSTPTPRELYMEHLVSQSRNAVTDVRLDGVSIPAGGTMTLAVGNTYTITLEGYTATQGYNQLESFINFPNTIFQVNSVTSTFTAGTSPIDTLYADACGWDNVPSSPTYRSCIVSDNKSGGNVTVTYNVTILKVPSAPLVNPEPLSTLLYDFSGSSYHYNSDYGISTRYAQIIDPATAVSISKAFSPSTIPPGGSSTLTVTLINSAATTISGANFSDTLPVLSGSQMVVATPATYSSSGCGSAPTLVFAPLAGASSFSVSGATLAPNGSCTLSISVSVPSTPTTGIYPNQITNFRVGSSPTAGITSNIANLTINSSAGSVGTGICGQALAQWIFPTGFSLTSPAPYATNTTVTATASLGSGITIPIQGANDHTVTPANTFSWGSNGGIDSNTTTLNFTYDDYFQFALNTTGFMSVDLTFYAQSKPNNGPQGVAVYVGSTTKTTGSATDPGTQLYSNATVIAAQNTWYPVTLTNITNINSSGTTYFRIYGFNSNNISNGFDVYLDDVTFTGCGAALKPTLTKTFNTNPVVVNGTSTLSFTITNPNATTLNGIQFTDILPAGLTITNSGPTAVCGGTLTTTAATGTITFTGGVLAGGASCTITTPAVTATTAGPHPNVSGFISSTESGTNSTATGSAKASLVAVLPPTIEKVFNPNPVIPGSTSTLTFTITNPNPSDALPAVAFSDTFPTTPSAMTVANPPATTNTCGGSLQDNLGGALAAGDPGIQLTGGSIAAGSNCTVTVNIVVPAVTTGDYANVTSAVTTTIGGQTRGTDTGTSTLTVNPPNPDITLTKQVSSSATGPWSNYLSVPTGSTVYYRLVVENIGDVPLSTTTVTDPLLTLCTNAQWQASNASWPTLPVASPTQDPTATCTVSVTSVVGEHPNTATATGVYNVVNYTDTGSAIYVGVNPPTVTKSFSPNPILSGGTSTLTITIVNPAANTVALTGVAFTDTFPLGLQVAATPNATTTNCGSPTFAPVATDTTLTFTGGTVAVGGTCTLTVDVTAAVDGSYQNTVTVSTTNGGSSTPSTGTLTVSPLADLSVTKTDGSATYTPGGTTTYTIVASNAGPSNVTGATLADTFPAAITSATWTCAGAGGATCPAASGSGNINATVNIPSGGSLTYTVTANINSGATGNLVNTATITAPVGTTDSTPGNNSATDTDTASPSADLSITKTDNSATYVPGAAIGYTVMVTNNGPSNVTGAMVADTIPANITGATWTCAASTGASCTASGSGDINDMVTIPAGGSVTYTIIGVVSGAATGNLSNAATVTVPVGTTDPVPGNNTSTDTNTPAACVNGQFASWTFTDNNFNAATGAGLFTYDTVGLNAPTWNASQLPADTPAISFTGATNAGYLAGNDYVDFAVPTNGRGAISLSLIDFRSGTGPTSFVVYYSTDGTTYNALPAGTVYTIANGAWISRTIDFSTVTGLNNNSNAHFRLYAYGGTSGLGTWRMDNVSFSGGCLADVAITKTLDTAGPYSVGQSLTYTVSVTNNGPSAATGISVTDTPTNLTISNVTSPTMTCTGNAFPCTLANLANSVSATITVTATIDAPGAFDNSATVTATSSDPDSTNNTDNTGNGGNASPTINAVDDDYSGTPINGGAGGTTASVIVNDTTNGNAAVITTNVALTPGSAPTPATGSITMNTDGTITVAVGTTPGTYTYPYTICTIPATTPATCDTANATVVVTAPTINAVDDTATTPANTSVITVVTTNDTYVGGNIAPASVSVTAQPAAGTGTVVCTDASCQYTPPAGFVGTTTYTYQVCLAAPYGTVCDTAVVTVTVTPTINAVDDDYRSTPINAGDGGTTASVIDNDTTNGVAASIGINVTLTPGAAPAPASGSITMNADGTITVAAGTTAGTYNYPYTICTNPATTPATCDTATATVEVTAPTITANNDTATTTANTSITTVVTMNDANVGGTIDPNSVTVTVPPVNGTVVCTSASCVYTTPAGFVGTVTYTYEVCLAAPNGSVCDTAVVTVDVTPTIDAINDDYSATPINGGDGGTTASVIGNDTTNSVAAVIGTNVTLTPGAAPAPASGSITMNADGTITVVAGTTPGIYTYPYTICTDPATTPATCDTANATVVVAAATITANDDTATTPANTPVTTVVTTNDTNVGGNIDLNSVAVTVQPATGSVVCTGASCLYTPLAGFAGTITYTYEVCLEAPNASVCDTAVVTVNVTPTIDAVDDNYAPINGFSGGTTASVIGNDTTNGAAAVIGTNVTLTPGTAPTPAAGSITMNANGTITVAAGTTAGIYTYPYTICTDPATTPATCDTATATVVVSAAPILAVDDTAGPVNGLTGATNVLNVFSNDTLNSVAVNPADVTLTRQLGGDIELTLNANGSVDVAAGTPAGTYTFDYQICENLNPINCSIATVTVTVGTPVIDAVDNNFGSVSGITGGTTATVLANDTLNGGSVTIGAGGNATLTPGTAPTPAAGSITMNADGTITIAPGTTAGSYNYLYTICDVLNPTNCDTATATIVVAAAAIDAVDNNFGPVSGFVGGTTAAVLANDTLNGGAVTVGAGGNVTLTPGTGPAPVAGSITMNADGTITVTAGTTAGTYTYPYTICEVLNPANCDTATATVIVGLPVIDAVNDNYSGSPINGGVGGNAGNAFTNDTLNGTLVNAAQITATLITPASDPGITLNLTTGSVDVAAGTPAGTYTITYQICENINPTNCDTATITVLVNPPANIGGVVFHDADLNGSKSGSEAGLVGVTVNLYDSTGTTLIATTTTGAGGTYSFPNLTPGSYTVVEIDPAGYVSSTSNSVPVTIAAGGSGTANFGDYQLPNTALSSISGLVYDDANGNGIYEAGELPLSGVTVELRNNLGTVIGTVVTGASGTYNFPNLAAGSYTVTETDPAGYTSTTLNNVAVNLSAGTSTTVNFGDQAGAALIADPAVTKFGSPTNAVVGDIVVYTITVGNNGNGNAANVILTDTKPAFLDIVSITISPNPGLTPVITGTTFTINFGTVTPTDFYTITVLTRVNALGVPPGGANSVQISSTSVTDRLFNNAAAAGLVISVTNNPSSSSSSVLPATGFAPNVVTDVRPQPKDLRYASTDLTLEIPSLGIKLSVVGVPKKNGVWDVSWLGNQAGWLEGTAFPSWNGNSILTSHVYSSNGLSGPFVNLGKLKYGDKVIIHAYGQKYTFEVRTNAVVGPNDASVLKHEEKSWLTLVTCKEYDEKTNTYKKRTVVRAVLVKVEAE